MSPRGGILPAVQLHSPPPMDITSLSQIGPYRVERFIDAGAFAWVFEVRDPKFTGRRLALKMLMP
ncbi:MAG TPA: hypothetical protein ENO23_11295, partial [Alphaproteobacteria bacterium]|nr:hypothetical protein [Alphaproteobacteria bacterium]